MISIFSEDLQYSRIINVEMGRNANVKIDSRSSSVYMYVCMSAYFVCLNCRKRFFGEI